MAGKRILVVDDDPDIVEYICTFLEDSGYEMRSADASASALVELEDSAVDLVILDVLMPGRSGLDLLVTIRKDARWAELPVILITGSDRVLEDRGQSYLDPQAGLRGADAVLGKPLKREELLRCVQQLGVR